LYFRINEVENLLIPPFCTYCGKNLSNEEENLYLVSKKIKKMKKLNFKFWYCEECYTKKIKYDKAFDLEKNLYICGFIFLIISIISFLILSLIFADVVIKQSVESTLIIIEILLITFPPLFLYSFGSIYKNRTLKKLKKEGFTNFNQISIQKMKREYIIDDPLNTGHYHIFLKAIGYFGEGKVIIIPLYWMRNPTIKKKNKKIGAIFFENDEFADEFTKQNTGKIFTNFYLMFTPYLTKDELIYYLGLDLKEEDFIKIKKFIKICSGITLTIIVKGYRSSSIDLESFVNIAIEKFHLYEFEDLIVKLKNRYFLLAATLNDDFNEMRKIYLKEFSH